MISKIIKTITAFAILLLCSSCYGSWNITDPGNNVDERTKQLKYLSESEDPEFASSGIASLNGKYTVLVISDTHFGSLKKTIDCNRLFAWLDSLKNTEKYPAFAICLGDDVDHGKTDEYVQYINFCKKLRNEYGMKLILNACGNHDIYQNNWENWENYCYPHTSFYKFKTQKFSWYCLDTASGAIGFSQYKSILADFERDSRPKIIYTHYPFTRFNYDCSNLAETTERNKLLSDFSKNNVLCLMGGHNHTITFDDLGYYDYGIPSLCYNEAWGLLFIDETAASARVEIFQ